MKSLTQSHGARSWGAETRNRAPRCLVAVSWGLFWGESLAFLYLDTTPARGNPWCSFGLIQAQAWAGDPETQATGRSQHEGSPGLTRSLGSWAGRLKPRPAWGEGDTVSTCLAPALTLLCPLDLTFWSPKSADLGRNLRSASLMGDLREATLCLSPHLLIHKMGSMAEPPCRG